MLHSSIEVEPLGIKKTRNWEKIEREIQYQLHEVYPSFGGLQKWDALVASGSISWSKPEGEAFS